MTSESTLLSETDRAWIEEAEVASDRAAAISMVALLELMLADAIRSRLVKLSNTQDDTLFGDKEPLGTLYAKINFGFALGLYGPKTKALLHAIRRIRNRFAHYHEVDHFDHPDVLERCQLLPTHNKRGEKIEGTRKRFNFALIEIGFALGPALRPGGESRPILLSTLP